MIEKVVEPQGAQAVVDEIKLKFSKLTDEDMAFVLIRAFFDSAGLLWDEGREMSDKLSAEFHAWFDEPRNRSAKIAALDRLMEAENEKLTGHCNPL